MSRHCSHLRRRNRSYGAGDECHLWYAYLLFFILVLRSDQLVPHCLLWHTNKDIKLAARLVNVFTAFYARYYTGWTPEKFREEISRNVSVIPKAKARETQSKMLTYGLKFVHDLHFRCAFCSRLHRSGTYPVNRQFHLQDFY